MPFDRFGPRFLRIRLNGIGKSCGPQQSPDFTLVRQCSENPGHQSFEAIVFPTTERDNRLDPLPYRLLRNPRLSLGKFDRPKSKTMSVDLHSGEGKTSGCRGFIRCFPRFGPREIRAVSSEYSDLVGRGL